MYDILIFFLLSLFFLSSYIFDHFYHKYMESRYRKRRLNTFYYCYHVHYFFHSFVKQNNWGTWQQGMMMCTHTKKNLIHIHKVIHNIIYACIYIYINMSLNFHLVRRTKKKSAAVKKCTHAVIFISQQANKKYISMFVLPLHPTCSCCHHCTDKRRERKKTKNRVMHFALFLVKKDEKKKKMERFFFLL